MNVKFPEWMAKCQKPQVLAGAAALILLLALALCWTAWRWGIASDRLEMLQQQAAVGFLRPPSSTRTLRIDPRAARIARIDVAGLPQRIDFLIAVATDRYVQFRVSLLREDGTALLHAERLARDSNGDLRISLNSTLLPNGPYRIRIEGHNWRGELQPVAEAQFQLMGR
jgi:hypothetical protein